MSHAHSPKEYIAPYEMLTEWDEVLLGDKELLKEMAEPHMPALLEAARRDITHERKLRNLRPNLLQPEELVGETLIHAWQARHGRSERMPLKDWLLEIQKHALQKLVDEEKKFHESIAVSLEEPVPVETESEADENEYWQWVEPPARDRWEDVIPDENAQPIAA